MIRALLSKFKITDNPRKFALYERVVEGDKREYTHTHTHAHTLTHSLTRTHTLSHTHTHTHTHIHKERCTNANICACPAWQKARFNAFVMGFTAAVMRRMVDDELPLPLCLSWTSSGLETRRFVLQENDTGEIIVSAAHARGSEPITAVLQRCDWACSIWVDLIPSTSK